MGHVWCRVEFLCHDINVHVPHHVNSKIPWYNLRAATDSLRQNWGQVRYHGLPGAALDQAVVLPSAVHSITQGSVPQLNSCEEVGMRASCSRFWSFHSDCQLLRSLQIKL